MTPEEIQKVVDTAVSTALAKVDLTEALKPYITDWTETVRTFVTEMIEATGSKDEEKEEEKTDAKKDPLLDRIQLLEKTLEEKQQAEARQQLLNAIGVSVDTHKPLFRQQAIASIEGLTNGATYVNEQYMINGKTLAEVTSEFFKTPYGAHLLPPSGKGAGSSDQSTEKQPETPIGELLAQAFG